MLLGGGYHRGVALNGSSASSLASASSRKPFSDAARDDDPVICSLSALYPYLYLYI